MNSRRYFLYSEKNGRSICREFFENIHKNYKDFIIVHEPLKENIKSENDNWKTYDSEELGIVIEVFVDMVISVSFSKGGTFYNNPQEIHAYPYPLYNSFSLKTYSIPDHLKEQPFNLFLQLGHGNCPVMYM